MRRVLTLSALPHTWILDIDGTVFKHNGYKTDGHDTILPSAKQFLSSLPKDDMVIFITSRTEEYRQITERFLDENGIRYDALICGAPAGERILINDEKPRGLNSAKAICTKRDEGIDVQVVIDDAI